MTHINRNRLTVDSAGKWRIYWGTGPMPTGASAIGVVKSSHDVGALIRLSSGAYVQGNYGAIKPLPKAKVIGAINAS